MGLLGSVNGSVCQELLGDLRFGDVQCSAVSVKIWIRRSKMDQMGRGAQVELLRGDSLHLCPVAAMAQFLLVRPRVEGALFVHRYGSFLSKFQFTAVFRKGLAAGGLVPEEFSAQSFRIGAATEAARWGLPGKP